jgi:hypothetical protein
MVTGVVILHALVMSKVPAAPPHGGESVPARVKEVLEVLKEVAPRDPSPSNYRLSKPISEIFFRDISSAGVLFSDVLPDAPGQLTVDQVRKALKTEKGRVYEYIVGLALVASRSGDYSYLSFQRQGETVTVVLPHFDLTFENEKGSLKLREIRSTDPGGD